MRFFPKNWLTAKGLILFINVCEAGSWSPNGLIELPEVRFEFPFNLIGKGTMVYLTGRSWRLLKSWCTGGAQNNDFGVCYLCSEQMVFFALMPK